MLGHLNTKKRKMKKKKSKNTTFVLNYDVVDFD